MSTLFLALETATEVCSVALFKGEEVLASRESGALKYDHAENLHPFIEEVLQEAKVSLNTLSFIAVSQGPGSYTGLRIGVAAAKGLCFALGVPLVAVNPLQAMVYGCLSSGKYAEDLILHPMLDARRQEVFTQSYNVKGEPLDEIQATILEEGDGFFARENILALGPGADKFQEQYQNGNQWKPKVFPSAKDMGTVALQKFQTNQTEDLAYFEPFYLKDFIAIPAKPKFNRRST